jgi:flagellar basal body-associated protein FliL
MIAHRRELLMHNINSLWKTIIVLMVVKICSLIIICYAMINYETALAAENSGAPIDYQTVWMVSKN